MRSLPTAFESPAQSQAHAFERIQISRAAQISRAISLSLSPCIRIISHNHKLPHSSEFESSALSLSLSRIRVYSDHRAQSQVPPFKWVWISIANNPSRIRTNSNLPSDLYLPNSSEFESPAWSLSLSRIRVNSNHRSQSQALRSEGIWIEKYC